MPDDKGKIITLHDSEESLVNQDEVIDKEASADPKEDGPGDYDDIQPTEPSFSHGVTLIANLNGEGFQIVPVDNGQQLRIATVDDIVGLLAMAQTHIQSNLASSKVINELNRKAQAAAQAKAINDKRSQQRR